MVLLSRDSHGHITLEVTLQAGQVGESTVEGRWTFSKQRSQVVFPSVALKPSAGSFSQTTAGMASGWGDSEMRQMERDTATLAAGRQ
jgi:hypothetical protein